MEVHYLIQIERSDGRRFHRFGVDVREKGISGEEFYRHTSTLHKHGTHIKRRKKKTIRSTHYKHVTRIIIYVDPDTSLVAIAAAVKYTASTHITKLMFYWIVESQTETRTRHCRPIIWHCISFQSYSGTIL